jgi:hypothetical protein
VLRDGEAFSLGYPFQQYREMRFGFEGTDGLHTNQFRLVEFVDGVYGAA